MDVDALLAELADELATEEVSGSFQAKLWIGTGLQIAAQLVERKRISLICAGILGDATETD